MSKHKTESLPIVTHYVYMLACADTTIYVGSTNNLERRLHQHNFAKGGAHYTKIRRPVVLVYHELVATLAEARAREATLKRLTRAQKLSLVSASKEFLLGGE